MNSHNTPIFGSQVLIDEVVQHVYDNNNPGRKCKHCDKTLQSTDVDSSFIQVITKERIDADELERMRAEGTDKDEDGNEILFCTSMYPMFVCSTECFQMLVLQQFITCDKFVIKEHK